MPSGSHANGCLRDVHPKGLTVLASPLQSCLDPCQVHSLATTGIKERDLLCAQAISDMCQMHA